MSGEPTRSGPYVDSVPMPPKSDPRELFRLLIACLAVVVVLLATIATIDRAWLDCAGDLDAPERFAVRLPLLAVVLPLTLAALSIVGLAITVALQRKRWIVWALVLGVSLALTCVAAIRIAVPNPFGPSGAEHCPASDTAALALTASLLGDILEH